MIGIQGHQMDSKNEVTWLSEAERNNVRAQFGAAVGKLIGVMSANKDILPECYNKNGLGTLEDALLNISLEIQSGEK